jgi:hypothetical protein
MQLFSVHGSHAITSLKNMINISHGIKSSLCHPDPMKKNPYCALCRDARAKKQAIYIVMHIYKRLDLEIGIRYPEISLIMEDKMCKGCPL